MTNKPYNLTSEHFARAYADIDRRRGELIASHQTAIATVAGHEAAMAELGHELGELEACEITAAKVAARYPEDSGVRRPAKKARARKAVNADGSPRLRNTGRPYKRKDDARIAAASRGQLEQLARDLDRPYSGVLKRHEILLKQRKREKIHEPAEKEIDEVLFEPLQMIDEELDHFEPSSSENPEILEPTPAALGKPESQEPDMTNPGFRQLSPRVAVQDSAARELAEFDARRQRTPRAKPGIPVRGLTNDGPGKERFLDPVAFASRRPD